MVTAIARVTIETGIPLGIIHRGTANAFAVALGLPTDLKQAYETILRMTGPKPMIYVRFSLKSS